MRERPTGAELLEIARQVLLQELLPLLPESSRYAARMTANAMAIAGRDALRDAGAEDLLERRAQALLGIGMSDDGWTALAAAIRSGRFDRGAPGHDDARALLRDYAMARCAISNPRACEARVDPAP